MNIQHWLFGHGCEPDHNCRGNDIVKAPTPPSLTVPAGCWVALGVGAAVGCWMLWRSRKSSV